MSVAQDFVQDSGMSLEPALFETAADLNFQLPDPADDQLPELDFQQQVDLAWQVCDRFDLQTDIWRGRILRVVRDREKRQGEGRGSGFLNWLKDREISKTQAYSWIELADSADTLLASQELQPAEIEQFSKRAFVETAQASPEVQQLVSESARQGNRITRREVRELSDQWTAMTSDLVPSEIRAKAADNTIPTRYLAPLVKELQKLPVSHQRSLQSEISASPDIDTLKQITADARYLARYLEAATQVRALDPSTFNLEQALDEALRLGCLDLTADLMSQAAQLEQTLAKLYTTWKRVGSLADKLDGNCGASTPQLRILLQQLSILSSETLELTIGQDAAQRLIQMTISEMSLKSGEDPF